MRSSITEALKLLLNEDDHGAFDQRTLLAAQHRITARGEMLKLLRGQCCLADWLASEYEEDASATKLMTFSNSPQRLYKFLNRLGYAWSAQRRVWRLFRNLSKPRKIRIEA